MVIVLSYLVVLRAILDGILYKVLASGWQLVKQFGQLVIVDAHFLPMSLVLGKGLAVLSKRAVHAFAPTSVDELCMLLPRAMCCAQTHSLLESMPLLLLCVRILLLA